VAEISKRSAFLGALLALLPALCAAQTDRFRAIDRNRDGFISSEEWYRQSGAAPVPFTVVDLNGDGKISESEFLEWSSARGGAAVRGLTTADRFRAIDTNKDGVISANDSITALPRCGTSRRRRVSRCATFAAPNTIQPDTGAAITDHEHAEYGSNSRRELA
jgi:hypothetical protein